MARRLTVLFALITLFGVAACSSPTAPKPPKGCQVVNGVNTCPNG